MAVETLFFTLDSKQIADFIRQAQFSVCYAGPSIQLEPAKAMAEVAQRIGPDALTLCIDFDERIMRMGYGDIEAIKTIQRAGIVMNDVQGLRLAFIIVDELGYIFTPTALYLEAEPAQKVAPNAMRLSKQQITEAMARLSPAANVIAEAMAETKEEKDRISALPLEIDSKKVSADKIRKVESNLENAPPVKFDIARQVRVFEPYFQYIEMSMTGAAIQRHRLTIPPSIQNLGNNKEIEGRLRTTFDLIERNSKLSSKQLEKELNEIRKNFTRSLGKNHGRVVLKAAKPALNKRIDEFKKKLEEHQNNVEKELQNHLDKSRQQIIDYYLPIVLSNPPDFLIGQSPSGKPTEEHARKWLNRELDRVFPTSDSLVKKMELEVRFKDVTFETLNRKDFLSSIKNAYPDNDWDQAYNEFKAAGEAEKKKAKEIT